MRGGGWVQGLLTSLPGFHVPVCNPVTTFQSTAPRFFTLCVWLLIRVAINSELWAFVGELCWHFCYDFQVYQSHPNPSKKDYKVLHCHCGLTWCGCAGNIRLTVSSLTNPFPPLNASRDKQVSCFLYQTSESVRCNAFKRLVAMDTIKSLWCGSKQKNKQNSNIKNLNRVN